jgi:hypothetical protein
MKAVRALLPLRSLSMAGVCLTFIALLGCGDASKGRVTGKVTYKGAPVTGGLITLIPTSGTGAAFTIPIQADGSFTAKDVPLGEMGVGISTDDVPEAGGMKPPPGVQMPAPPTPPKDSPAPAPTASADTSNMPKRVVIPTKYKEPKTSGLNWEIKGGSNTYKTFDLTD